MTRTENYFENAQSDAADTALHFFDDIMEQLLDGGEASTDLLNDYPNGDAYHHESHVDKDYSLVDASNLLDQLDDYEETDYGLWEGLEPRRAIAVQAAHTYGNAVYRLFRELVKEINEHWDTDVILQDIKQDREAYLTDNPGETETPFDGTIRAMIKAVIEGENS